MNLELAAAIREEFDAVRDRWVTHLLEAAGSPYRERPRAELEETAAHSLEACVQFLEGREEALGEFLHAIIAFRLSQGFPLSELYRASAGFRIAVAPLIQARYTDPTALMRASADVTAVNDRATLRLSEEWQRLTTERLTEVSRLNEERVENLASLIEENRRLAEALSGANSRLHAILRSVDSAILVVDPDGRIIYANPRVRDLLGVDPDALIGRDKRDVIATQIKILFRDPDAVEERLRLHERVEEETSDELEAVSPSPRWLKRYSALVRDESGRVLGRITIYTDITEARRTRELLEQMVLARTREIQELSQRLVQRERLAAIGELAASIAHELRNPLGVIANASYLLRRKLAASSADPELTAALTKTLETTETHVQRCSRVITDLLDFVRARPLRTDTVNPPALLQNALREHFIPPSIRVITEVAPELPSFVGDEPFLQQAVSNLIANALRAMSNRERGELRVACRPAQAGIEIVVADNGTGMTEEVRARIFEPLFTTSPGGTGLGLPLVKRIVEAHEGRLSIETAPDAGTTVTIFLPFRETGDVTPETETRRKLE